MKIIITENQELTIDSYINQQRNMFIRDSDIIETSLRNELDDWNMIRVVINYDEDGAINQVINDVYSYWNHYNRQWGDDTISKQILKDMYSDRIRKKYRYLRKENKHTVDAFKNNRKV